MYQLGAIALMVLTAAGILPLAFVPSLVNSTAGQPALFALLFAVTSLGLAGVVWSALRCSRRPREYRPEGPAGDSRPWPTFRWQSTACVLAIGGFLGLLHTGPVMNAVLRRSEDTAQAVTALKSQSLESNRLVSFGPVHHLFAYHYGHTIPRLAWPKDERQMPGNLDYFCFAADVQAGRELPFAWEQVAVISCERFRQASPEQRVIVGRRLPLGRQTATRAHIGPN
jgi:hypothetical protein